MTEQGKAAAPAVLDPDKGIEGPPRSPGRKEPAYRGFQGRVEGSTSPAVALRRVMGIVGPWRHAFEVAYDPDHRGRRTPEDAARPVAGDPRRKDYDRRLDQALQEPTRLVPSLVPYLARDLTAYVASTRVNRPRNDGPRCVGPAEVDCQTDIFG
jgi:hypothetical protein